MGRESFLNHFNLLKMTRRTNFPFSNFFFNLDNCTSWPDKVVIVSLKPFELGNKHHAPLPPQRITLWLCGYIYDGVAMDTCQCHQTHYYSYYISIFIVARPTLINSAQPIITINY